MNINRNIMLRTERLHVQLGSRMILEDINFSAKPGELIGIIGPNGCGKTTFLNAISGFVPIAIGTVNFSGKDIEKMEAHNRARLGIGRSFQHVGIFKEMTVEENLTLAIETAEQFPWWWMFSARYKSRLDHMVKDSLEEIGLIDHRVSVAGVLSGGQLRLLELARLKLSKSKLLLIDEPTAGVAPILRNKLGQIIKSLAHDGDRTILIVEHDLKFLFDIVDRVVVLVEGRVYMEGKPEDIQKDKRLQEVYFGK